MEGSQEGGERGRCREWKALLGPGVIVVDGWCTFPSGGWESELRRADEQGSESSELVLERIVTEPGEGRQPALVKAVELHYEEPTETDYRTVRIVPDGITLDVVDAREGAG